MDLAVLAERAPNERRVAITPSSVKDLTDRGHQVAVEEGAGAKAGFSDAQYQEAGAKVGAFEDVLQTSALPSSSTDEALVVAVITPTRDLVERLDRRHVLVALFDPNTETELVAALAAQESTVFSLQLMPRITRAQSMDVLSSMATVVGYEAAVMAASRAPRLFPMLMTAAGTVPAVKAVVIGAGVAGLQAIATCKRLGASVEAYDIRPAAAEQIESVGAKAINLALDTSSSEDASGYAGQQSGDLNQQQAERLTPYIAQADVVISTAAIPGQESPELITKDAVETMKPGSVIIDLAARQGGNCRLTRPDEEVNHNGVTILGPTNLASNAATTASRMYSTNLVTFLRHLTPEGQLVIDRDDEITAATLVCPQAPSIGDNV